LLAYNFIFGGNSVNGINQSNSVIGIKLLKAQSDPIKRRPLYNTLQLSNKVITVNIVSSIIYLYFKEQWAPLNVITLGLS
jgi:hypothetical protein